nr:hypothetical protein [Tanacetum cinerariifolium]
PIGSKEETERLKRKGLNLEKEQVKKQKLSEETPKIETTTKEFTEEKIKEMMQEDLNQLWALVNEYLNIRPASSDKEMELWVELKRMYEPDLEDQLWTLTQNYMHAPIEWKLYDLSGVHYVAAKDKEIFMLVEKNYPLRRGLAFVMISYKLQVKDYLQMAEDLIRKIYNIANTLRKQSDLIKNGNKVLKRTVSTVEQIYEPTSVKEKLDMKNEMKARETLLMALPSRYQLNFHSYKDAKLLMKAIEKSINNTSSTNEVDNINFRVSTAHSQVNIVNSTSVDNLSDVVICAFLASQPNSPQLVREDLE